MGYIGPAATYSVLQDAGGSHWDLVVMTAIAGAESGWNTTAKSPTDDWGLMQINRYYHKALFRKYDWWKAGDNAKMAYAVWKSQHYRAWSTFTSGAYERYLPQARAAAGGTAEHVSAPVILGDIDDPPAAGKHDYSPKVYHTGRQMTDRWNSMHEYGKAFKRL